MINSDYAGVTIRTVTTAVTVSLDLRECLGASLPRLREGQTS